MMDERRKSDRPVIPVKSPNKAGRPVAEGMEGRGLTKGNSYQQNASRTPSRSDAPKCAGADTASSKEGDFGILKWFIRTFGDTPAGPRILDTLQCSDDLRSMGCVNARCCPMLPNFSCIV